jgi:hypothetical protein
MEFCKHKAPQIKIPWLQLPMPDNPDYYPTVIQPRKKRKLNSEDLPTPVLAKPVANSEPNTNVQVLSETNATNT